MMTAVFTSETYVNFYQTTGINIAENSHLHTHRSENRLSQPGLIICKLVFGIWLGEIIKD